MKVIASVIPLIDASRVSGYGVISLIKFLNMDKRKKSDKNSTKVFNRSLFKDTEWKLPQNRPSLKIRLTFDIKYRSISIKEFGIKGVDTLLHQDRLQLTYDGKKAEPDHIFCVLRGRYLHSTLRTSTSALRSLPKSDPSKTKRLWWKSDMGDGTGKYEDFQIFGIYGYMSLWDAVIDVKVTLRNTSSPATIGTCLIGNLFDLVQQHPDVDYALEEQQVQLGKQSLPERLHIETEWLPISNVAAEYFHPKNANGLAIYSRPDANNTFFDSICSTAEATRFRFFEVGDFTSVEPGNSIQPGIAIAANADIPVFYINRLLTDKQKSILTRLRSSQQWKERQDRSALTQSLYLRKKRGETISKEDYYKNQHQMLKQAKKMAQIYCGYGSEEESDGKKE